MDNCGYEGDNCGYEGDNCGYEGDNFTTFIETQTQEKKERNIKNESKPVKSRHDITTEQNPKCLYDE